MAIQHIYYFSWRDNRSVSTRYRALYMFDELKNVTVDFVFPGYSPTIQLKFWFVFLKVLLFRKKNSIIVFQKIYTNNLYSRLLKILLLFRSKNTIYDTDDADYIRYREDVIEHFMQSCSCCIVGSEFLKKYALKKNKNVHLLTSPVIAHNEIKGDKNVKLHIGWIGDYGANIGKILPYSHKKSLEELLYPALIELDFEYKLTLLGIKNPKDKVDIEALFKDKKNISLSIPENINWQDEKTIYTRIKDFDVGVSPMVNHEFNEAKSAFKAKQYLSCGVPVLASPVGESLCFIDHARNGYLCNNAMEFKEKIELFNQLNKNDYEKFKEEALIDVPKFNIENYTKKFIGLCDEIILSSQ